VCRQKKAPSNTITIENAGRGPGKKNAAQTPKGGREGRRRQRRQTWGFAKELLLASIWGRDVSARKGIPKGKKLDDLFGKRKKRDRLIRGGRKKSFQSPDLLMGEEERREESREVALKGGGEREGFRALKCNNC